MTSRVTLSNHGHTTSSVTVKLDKAFFSNNQQGRIVDHGLVVGTQYAVARGTHQLFDLVIAMLSVNKLNDGC